mgnify:CR=1 FL=1
MTTISPLRAMQIPTMESTRRRLTRRKRREDLERMEGMLVMRWVGKAPARGRRTRNKGCEFAGGTKERGLGDRRGETERDASGRERDDEVASEEREREPLTQFK